MASTTVRYVTNDQRFLIELSGLMPLTVHYAYIDNNLISSSDIKPIGGSLGNQIKTDRNGQVSFEYYYRGSVLADYTPWAEAQKIQANLANIKRVVIGNRSASTLDPNYVSNFLSYTTAVINVNVLTSSHETTPAAIIKYVEVPGQVYHVAGTLF